jgi:hypothetical protein
MPANCKKAVSYMAENSGIIAALTQQKILSGDPDYALKRIKEASYQTGKGHGPRYIRVRTTPPTRTAYQPMLPAGNTTFNVINPQTGVANAVTGDKTGRGCNLPAETLQYGYDVRTRCLQGKALEAGPWCIMDLLEKEAFKPLLATLWKDLPRYAKEDFGRQLLRDVVTYSEHKFSIDVGFPMSTGVPYFPTAPKGGPSIGFLRQIERLMMAEGWEDGADTPLIMGRRALQVSMSREAIEWAISKRKAELGLTLDSTIHSDDGTFGKTLTYEGIQFVEAKLPTRGYLRQVGVGIYEFVEIDPTIITTANGEGFWPKPNPEYYSSHVSVGGERLRVCEIGYIIHPTAMERQSLGSIPSVPGKTFTRNFDFEVNPIPDWELAAKGCNKDQFFFGYRMLHAYAPLPLNPELMTAFIYLAPTNRIEITDPWVDLGTAASNPLSLAALTPPQQTDCNVCEQPAIAAREPVDITCSDLYPANGAGVIRFRQVAYFVDESAGNLTIIVDRVGGSVGASSVVITLTEGTATEPQNWTKPTGFAGTGPFTKTLNWADGVLGPVTVVVPIVAAVGDDDGKQFTGSLGTVSGSTLGAATTATVTILDPDEAV